MDRYTGGSRDMSCNQTGTLSRLKSNESAHTNAQDTFENIIKILRKGTPLALAASSAISGGLTTSKKCGNS